MAKTKSTHIALEIEAFEKKIKEFQKYLSGRDINKIASYAEDVSKEISDQLKIMNAIPILLEQLNKLREVNEKKIESRGGNDISGLADNFLKNK